MTLLDHALAYASGGWAVFPLNGKIPYTPNGYKDATTDHGRIRDWWNRWPDANIGAPVPAGLIVLDVDPRNGGTVEALGDLPPTLTAWSGRGDGGRHLYFRLPDNLTEITSTRLPRGVDLKRHGHMVVPPSIHPDTGQEYWWGTGQPAAPLPEHLIELIRYQARPVYTGPRRDPTEAGAGLIATVATAPEGKRNDFLFWAAGRASTEGILDALEDDLLAAAVSAGLPESEARTAIRSARRHTQRRTA
ncbi:MAG: bifunctional DNA primase/polymerase [Nocardioides sp.]|nr:bifunctional DNA primase/polymerase [Nocardioides sp.]